ncbi:MAG: ribonuclease P protein component [Candidatus Paceibacterota bacterium]
MGSLFVVKKYKKNSQAKPLIIIISRKVSKKATERNLLKRRIKDIIKTLKNKINGDLRIITKPGAEKLNFRELKEEITKKII